MNDQEFLAHIAEDGRRQSVEEHLTGTARRCAAFAAAEEPSELRAEMADLDDQLRLLAEMERFSIKNVL